MVVSTRTSAKKHIPSAISLNGLSIRSPTKSPKKRGSKNITKRGSLKTTPAVDTGTGKKKKRDARAAGQQSARKKKYAESRAKKLDTSPTSVALNAAPSYRGEATAMAKKLLQIITQVAQVTPNPVNDSALRGMFDFFNYMPTSTKCFEGILARRQLNPKLKLWIFLKTEGSLAGYNSIVERFNSDALSIITIVESEVPPINYAAKYNRMSDATDFIPFANVELAWEKAEFDENISILVSKGQVRNSNAYNILPLNRPSKIEHLLPTMLQPGLEEQQLGFTYKRIDAMARFEYIEEDCKDMTEVEDSLTMSDLKPLIGAAEICKEQVLEHYHSQVQMEKSYFNRMVANLAEKGQVEDTVIKACLQGMKINKIYPAYDEETLPHPRVVRTFFGEQITGNVKTPKYDDRSLFGLVDGLF